MKEADVLELCKACRVEKEIATKNIPRPVHERAHACLRGKVDVLLQKKHMNVSTSEEMHALLDRAVREGLHFEAIAFSPQDYVQDSPV